MPNQMMQVSFEQPGNPDVMQITEGVIPTPGPGQVLIAVRAAGINRPDLAQRKGLYPPPPGASPILGLEVSGLIVSAPSESGFISGDVVCALVAGGGYAQYCVADYRHCLKIPGGLSFEEAAGIPENYFTVWANVFQIAQLRVGENFLVHGGSSGIGTTAIQLAHAFGARVLVTAGSAKKCAACLELGADEAINYKERDFSEVFQNIDVVLDMIGGDYTQKNIQCMAQQGRIVQIATQLGKEVSIDLMQIMRKRLMLTGSTLRPRSDDDKAQIARELKSKVWPLFELKKVKVQVDQIFSFKSVIEAHRALERGDHIGKIILNGFSV